MDRHHQRSAAGTTEDSVSTFNYERALARLGGDPHLFHEIAILFLEDSPQLLDRAKQGLDMRDLPSLERAAHSLKGLSVNFDAHQVAAAAYSLEQCAHDGDLERAAVRLAEMERELARLQADLAEFRNHSGGAEKPGS